MTGKKLMKSGHKSRRGNLSSSKVEEKIICFQLIQTVDAIIYIKFLIGASCCAIP
jgi:hypothetical protein